MPVFCREAPGGRASGASNLRQVFSLYPELRAIVEARVLNPTPDAGTKVDFVAVKGGFKLVPVQSEVSPLTVRFAGRVSKSVSIEAMDKEMLAANIDA